MQNSSIFKPKQKILTFAISDAPLRSVQHSTRRARREALNSVLPALLFCAGSYAPFFGLNWFNTEFSLATRLVTRFQAGSVFSKDWNAPVQTCGIIFPRRFFFWITISKKRIILPTLEISAIFHVWYTIYTHILEIAVKGLMYPK